MAKKTKNFTLKLNNGMFEVHDFESILINYRITEYELYCALQLIYEEVGYFKNY